MNSNEALAYIDGAVTAYEANNDRAEAAFSVIRDVLDQLRTTESIRRGLAQSATGDVVDLGDFTQYTDTDDGVIQVGDVWDYATYDGPTSPHTVVAVTDDLVSVVWDNTGNPTTLRRDYFLSDRRLLSRRGQ